MGKSPPTPVYCGRCGCQFDNRGYIIKFRKGKPIALCPACCE